MARISRFFRNTQGQPTIEAFQWMGPASNVSVGVSATPVPATNTSGRKALIIQNLHASQNVYLGGAVVEVIGKELTSEPISGHSVIAGEWHKSVAGTNEWFFAKHDKTTTGMTQPAALYYATPSAASGIETAATQGTVGTLAAQHNFGWGNTDTLGFNTLYMRSDGGTQDSNPKVMYRALISYSSLPVSGTGYKLGPMDAITMTLDGSCRVWAIADGTTTTTTVVELG
jgi:hypothetical protein